MRAALPASLARDSTASARVHRPVSRADRGGFRASDFPALGDVPAWRCTLFLRRSYDGQPGITGGGIAPIVRISMRD